MKKLTYSPEIPANGIQDDSPYNQELFYRNDATMFVPDPFILYISDKTSTEFGYYYLYGTSYNVYKSKDLQEWINIGAVRKKTCDTEVDPWAVEVIFDSGKYYMFFSAKREKGADNLLYVAVSDHPYGPFEATSPLINWEEANSSLDTRKVESTVRTWNCIDSSPFIGADGNRYLLFCRVADDCGCDSVWGMQMIDWFTPDYGTLTRLSKTGYKTADGTVKIDYECDRDGNVNAERNEGPHIYIRKHSDSTATYFLTMSIRGLSDYTVIQAISDNPLGPFRKLEEDEGGILLANDHLSWDHIQGPGHHSFLTIDDELFVVYHQQAIRNIPDGHSWKRFLSMDRICFIENHYGQEVMVANGPTWSLQPKPQRHCDYRNIAAEAKISAEYGNNPEALTDGLLSLYKNKTFIPEFTTDKQTTICLEFDDYRDITAIQIFNSLHKETAFHAVKRVEFHGKDDIYYIDHLPFDWHSYSNAVSGEMRPGGSAVATFSPIAVKRIVITLDLPKKRQRVNVSEIVVLGN